MNTGEESGTWDFSESNNISENSLINKEKADSSL
jgi:hypothetical protein